MKKMSKKYAESSAKPWKSLPIGAYVTQCAQLVTHSIKGVNTNAAGGGVRIIPETDTDLPYACVRFGREQVALDYIKNATQPFASSIATEQMEAVQFNDFNRFSGTDADECAELWKNVIPSLSKPHVSAGTKISPRVRQILVDDHGVDISLTPLHSSGFSARLHRLTDEALKDISSDIQNGTVYHSFFDEVTIKVGGDKAQNAGRIHLVAAMQRAYRFAVPADADPNIRAVVSLHHRGVSTLPSVAMLEEYEQFLSKLRKHDEQRGLSLQRTDRRMDKEYSLIASMVRVILSRGDEAHNLMAPYVGTVIEDYASPNLPPVQRGLLNPVLRDDSWKRAFAKELAQRIAGARTKNGRTLIVGISGRSAEFLQKHILETFDE